MRRPEPLPDFPPIVGGPQSGPIFSHVDEVNGAVLSVIHSLTANGQYTGVGSVQSELFRRFPNCLSFIQRIGLYPDNIPAIVEHRRLIQSVNSQLWAYATTHNVLTLCDLECLIQTRFGDSARYLGPVYNLPVAQELCEVVAFHPRVCEAFAGGAIETVYRITTERLFEELNQFVCQNRYRLPSSHLRQINRWWESVFTQHMLCLFGEQDIPHDTAELTFSRLGVYGVRIKQFGKLIESIVEMLRPESLSRAAKLMQELLDTEVRRVYEKFAETTVSEEAIGKCMEV
nr:unnamed protein product [Spirometra erinaceieuropaei]